jgi:Chromo (CHRromatin Organisation MOdifier) domain
MLITTEDLSKSDQVPPNQLDNLCKHADDLLNTVSSELLRPPPPTPASEPPLRPLLPEPKARPPKRPLDDDVSGQDQQLPIKPAITKCDIPDDFYEVEDIISSKIIKLNGRFCKVILIKWKNYPDDANTWEPLRNLNAATKKLVKTRNF